MPAFSLIRKTPQRAQIAGITLDVSRQENHERSANLSSSPIEDGSVITDHVTLNPKKVTITAIISDVPIGATSPLIGAGVGAVSGLLGGFLGGIGGAAAALGVGSIASLVSQLPKSAKDSYSYLEELWSNREPFTLITALQKYDNMIMTSLSAPRSASIGGGLEFTAELEQVRIVRSSVIRIPASQLRSDSGIGESTNKLGKQASKEAKPETGRKSSLLFKAFG